MIEYTVDNQHRYKHLLWIIPLALFCTFCVHELVNFGTENTDNGTIKFILSTVNPLTFFTFFVMIKFTHEKFLWKYLFFRPPKYFGTWIGYITQRTTGSSENRETYKPVQLKIVQDFSRMKILFWSKDVTDPTRSDPTESKVIGISSSEGGDSVLTYAWSGYSLLGRSQLNHSTEHGDEYLSGNYVSNYPRVGHVKVRKVKNLDEHFYGRAQVLISRSERSYLGVYVNRKYIEKFLREMKAETRSEYSELVRIQSERDKSKYHVTLIHPDEYDESAHNYLVGKSFWFDLIGLGTQNENAHSTYYVACNCEVFQKIRTNDLSLGFSNLHISIGFKPDDLHTVPKVIENTKKPIWRLK